MEMTEIFEKLSTLTIEELYQVIAKSNQLIEDKKQEAIRLAQIEKERLERERLEKELKRQEEIAELQRRLRELQGEEAATAVTQPKMEEKVQSESVHSETVSQQSEMYSMIPCPHCCQMIPSDSKFCYHCGKNVKENTVQPNVQTKKDEEYSDSVKYMDDSVKKWSELAGEGDVSSWRRVEMSSPEEAKKLACYIKVTTKRILISTESMIKAGVRTTAFGAIGNLVVEEKGNPWVWIPLNAVKGYRMLDKKEIQIEADRMYTFRCSKSQDIYDALQSMIPDRIR